MEEMNTYAPDARSWFGGVLSRLFPSRYVPRPEDEDGWAPGFISTRTVCVLSWPDRLRLLVSGALKVEAYTQTSVPVARARTVSGCYVLPPGGKPAPPPPGVMTAAPEGTSHG